MTKDELVELISTALGDDNVNEDSSMENTDAWDSLGHLSLLTAIDNRLQGSAASISGLASATSVPAIAQLLIENKLLDSQ